MGERYLRSIRLLAECMQGFERHTAEAIRACDLTPPQFDIIATLGNTPGMTYKLLGEKTLTTKGTLTGIIERLEQKGLVERRRNDADKRSFYVCLTAAGEALFARAFPLVVSSGKEIFEHYTEAEFVALESQLRKMKDSLAAQSAKRPNQKNEDHAEDLPAER